MTPRELKGIPPELAARIAEGLALERAGQRAAARAIYEGALYALERAEHHAATASALLRWTGRTYADDADIEAAFDCYAAALAVAMANGDRPAVASVVNLMAIAEQQRGDFDEAMRLYRRAVKYASLAGEETLVAMIEQNLGTIAGLRGDQPTALTHYRAALAGYRRLGMEAPVGGLLNNLGMCYAQMRRFRSAEETYEEAYAAAGRSGDAGTQIAVAVNRAELFIARRDFAAARQWCDTSVMLAEQTGDQRALGDAYKHYGVIAREIGDFSGAEEFLGRAWQIAEQRHELVLAAHTARERAELYRRQERNRDTLRELNTAHRLFSQLRARRDVVETRRKLGELEGKFLEIVREWGASIESKDNYTSGHCDRVADFACTLARMAGFDPESLFWFRAGALLHDVGKLIVPSSILNKPGPLTPEERALMERHPAAGEKMLAGIEFPWDIKPMIRSHHERWDGTGYPDRIAGDEIPIAARILCLADVWDALTTDRPYRPAFPREKAMEIMASDSGKAFDPALFTLFRSVTEQPALPQAAPFGRPAVSPMRERAAS
ncbi:MAG TPA: HD domain-containing phosphohydrolase [Gemmatimonadaceae bacterium]|nr:HD domain-containing phosphohydrolase [Gemmatimonadaceae bacterium]